MRSVRISDRKLDEEQCQQGEHCRLDQADEHFKQDKRDGGDIRSEVLDDHKEHHTGEDVPEESERERDETDEFRHELEEPDKEADGRMDIEETRHVPEESELRNAGDLDGEKCDDGECERDIKVGVHAAQEAYLFSLMHTIEDAFDTRNKFHPIADEDEEKEGEEERREEERERLVFKRIMDELSRVTDDPLRDRLELSRDHGGPFPGRNHEDDEEYEHNPTHDERVCDRHSHESSKGLWGDGNVYSGLHKLNAPRGSSQGRPYSNMEEAKMRMCTISIDDQLLE